MFRIQWAVDIRAEDAGFQQKLIQVLKLLEGQGACVIEPLYVASGDGADRYGLPASQFETRLEAAFQATGLSSVRPLTSLRSPDLSLSSGVRTLMRYNTRSRPDLVVCGAHQAKGASHFLVGSFAELLILQAQTPTVLVTPNTVVPSRFERAVIVIEGPESLRSLQSLAPLILHLGIPLELWASDGQGLLDDAEKDCAQSGVTCRRVILPHQTTDGILEQARGGTLFVVQPSTDLMTSVALSNQTKAILNEACVPLWVAPLPKPAGLISDEELRRIAAGGRG